MTEFVSRPGDYYSQEKESKLCISFVIRVSTNVYNVYVMLRYVRKVSLSLCSILKANCNCHTYVTFFATLYFFFYWHWLPAILLCIFTYSIIGILLNSILVAALLLFWSRYFLCIHINCKYKKRERKRETAVCVCVWEREIVYRVSCIDPRFFSFLLLLDPSGCISAYRLLRLYIMSLDSFSSSESIQHICVQGFFGC